MTARRLDIIMAEEGADAHRGGREEAVLSKHHTAHIDGCEAVDILVGRDGIDDVLLVDMVGHRQLDDEAVDLVVVVEEVDSFEELRLGDRGGVAVDRRGEADLVAGFFLVGDIGLAGAVVAYEDGGEMGCTTALSGKVADLVGDLFFELDSKLFSVENFHIIDIEKISKGCVGGG